MEFRAGDADLYRYVANNPVAETDPTGEYVQIVITTVGGAIIGGVAGGITGGWSGAMGGAVSGAVQGAMLGACPLCGWWLPALGGFVGGALGNATTQVINMAWSGENWSTGEFMTATVLSTLAGGVGGKLFSPNVSGLGVSENIDWASLTKATQARYVASELMITAGTTVLSNIGTLAFGEVMGPAAKLGAKLNVGDTRSTSPNPIVGKEAITNSPSAALINPFGETSICTPVSQTYIDSDYSVMSFGVSDGSSVRYGPNNNLVWTDGLDAVGPSPPVDGAS